MTQDDINKILNQLMPEVRKDIIAGTGLEEILGKYADIIIEKVFTKKFLITIEIMAPQTATLTEAATLVEKHIPGSKVVHIEVLESLE